jgi:hypothetical protein
MNVSHLPGSDSRAGPVARDEIPQRLGAGHDQHYFTASKAMITP